MKSFLKRTAVNTVAEWKFTAKKRHADPFYKVKLDAVFTGPDGKAWVVPCFWAGKNVWKVRFAPPVPGNYAFETFCSDKTDSGLHKRTGILKAVTYRGSNPLYKHGPLGVSRDKSCLEHTDGTPFLWLGDTWWLGASKRIKWPGDFKKITADRKKKGFSLIQMVVGMPPDMDVFDKRAENEGGYCWEEKYKSINPAYFDHADKKIAHLVEEGLVPCILSGWGYYLLKIGKTRMKHLFRYLVARYAAYPVVWCAAGEQIMPWYLTKNYGKDKQRQKEGWTDVMQYLRTIDPFERSVTTHNLFMSDAREQVTDESVLDFNMFQGSQAGYNTLQANTNLLLRVVKKRPRMPVVNGETCYEGLMGGSWEDTQRVLWWSNILGGACGFTYGGCGVWCFESEKDPFGASPQGSVWNLTPWKTVMHFTGSAQVGLGRKILSRYPWYDCRPHQDWVTPAAGIKRWKAAWCMGIPEKLRIIYLADLVTNWQAHPKVKKLEKGITYRAVTINPRTGKKYPLGKIKGDKKGEWEIPILPVMQDMVIVLEKR